MQLVRNGAVGILGATIGGSVASVAAVESLVLINKHVFLPAMEYATKSLYGALGEDPLRTAQELEYA